MIMAILLPHLLKIGVLIDFKINQDFIVEELCINREKPIKMCNGKCYLSDKLKKVKEQEEKQAPSSKKEILEVNYYYFESNVLSLANNYLGKLNPDFRNEYSTSSFVAEFFRPPKLHLI